MTRDFSDKNGRFHDDSGRFVSLETILEDREKAHEKQHSLEQKAVDLQANEYARRLENLNHAHAESVRVQQTYVTSEKYEDRVEVIDDKLDKLELNSITREVRTALIDRLVHVEAEYISRKELDLRIKPLEKAATIARILIAGAPFVGGLILYVIQQAIK